MKTRLDAVRAAFPDYEIDEEIGRGSWALVVRAHHPLMKRSVAIKQLPATLAADERQRDRLLKESQILASLDHPHIVRVFDLRESDGSWFLVMELVEQGSVWDSQNKWSTHEWCIAVTLAAASGLAHAHEAGVLHRDIKPENLLISDQGLVKVADFGLARLAGAQTMTYADEILGTPAYMAPELVEGMRATAASDVYALATTLYETLTGRLPFPESGDVLELMLCRLREDPRPIAPDEAASPAIASLIMRALSRDPSERPQSAELFRAELSAAAGSTFGAGWVRRTGLTIFTPRSSMSGALHSAGLPSAPERGSRATVVGKVADVQLMGQSRLPQWSLEIRHADPRVMTRKVGLDAARTIGREADIQIDDAELSRHHLRLTPGISELLVEDLGSTNGTAVDGVRISAPTAARAGATITAGATTIEIIDTREQSPQNRQGLSVNASGVEVHFDGALLDHDEATRIARSVADRIEKFRRVTSFTHGHSLRIEVADEQLLSVAGGPTNTLVRVDERGTVWLTPETARAGEIPAALIVRAWTTRDGVDPRVAMALEGLAAIAEGVSSPDEELRNRGLADSPDDASSSDRTLLAASFAAFLMGRFDRDRILSALAAETQDSDARNFETELGTSLSDLHQEWCEHLQQESAPSMKGFIRTALTYLRPHRIRVLELTLLALVASGFTVFLAKITQWLFDDVLTISKDTGGFKGDFKQGASLLAWLGAGLIVSIAASFRQSVVAARLSSRIVRDVRVSMFQRLHSLPFSWYSQREQGDVVSRFLSDVHSFEQGISSLVKDLVAQVITLVVNIVLILKLSVAIGLVTILAAPLTILVYALMAGAAQRKSVDYEQCTGDLTSVLTESLEGKHTVRAYSLEDRENQRFRLIADRARESGAGLHGFIGFFQASVGVVTSLMRVGVMLLGVWLVLSGHIGVGTFVAALGVMGEIVAPLLQLAEVGQATQVASGSLVRIEEVLKAEPETDPPSGAHLKVGSGTIFLDRVWFEYEPGRPVLRNISLNLLPGTRTALVGPSGSGKSTLLSLIQRTADATQGKILVDDQDVEHLSRTSVREACGVVLQQTFLFKGTMRENILLAKPDATDDQVMAAAVAAGLSDFIAASPHGLDTPVGERGGSLSGGQRQRVGIARALLRDPRILILDEATSALDNKTERQVIHELATAANGRTTVAVTHRLSTIIDYDLIVVLSAGEIVETGTHDELLKLGGVYAGLWAEHDPDEEPAQERLDEPDPVREFDQRPNRASAVLRPSMSLRRSMING